MLSVALLVVAVCVNCFAVSITYGIGRIRISVSAQLVIAGVGTVILGVALALSGLVCAALPDSLCKAVSGVALMVLGIASIAQQMIVNRPKLA